MYSFLDILSTLEFSMRKFPIAGLIGSILVFGYLEGCDRSSSSTNSTDPAASATGWDTSYTLSARLVGGDEIAVDHPTVISPACSYALTIDASGVHIGAYTSGLGNSQVPLWGYDTAKGVTDTSIYRFRGDDLLLSVRDTNTLPSSCTDDLRWTIFHRLSGAGISGAWNSSFHDSLEILGGASLGDASIDSIAADLRAKNQEYAQAITKSGTTERVTISESNVRFQIHYGDWAKLQVAEFSGNMVPLTPQLSRYVPRDAEYSLDVQAVSPTTVVFTGNVTHEVVTETYLSRGVARFTSSDTSHATYIRYSSPSDVSQCASDPWFESFLLANLVGGNGRTSCDGTTGWPTRRQTWRLPLL